MHMTELRPRSCSIDWLFMLYSFSLWRAQAAAEQCRHLGRPPAASAERAASVQHKLAAVLGSAEGVCGNSQSQANVDDTDAASRCWSPSDVEEITTESSSQLRLDQGFIALPNTYNFHCLWNS